VFLKFYNLCLDKYFKKKIFTVGYYDESLTRDDVYAKDAPDNYLGQENCIGAILGGFKLQDLGLDDISCTEPMGVMCEVISSLIVCYCYFKTTKMTISSIFC
jgi:hypothetical protein